MGSKTTKLLLLDSLLQERLARKWGERESYLVPSATTGCHLVFTKFLVFYLPGVHQVFLGSATW